MVKNFFVMNQGGRFRMFRRSSHVDQGLQCNLNGYMPSTENFSLMSYTIIPNPLVSRILGSKESNIFHALESLGYLTFLIKLIFSTC